MRILSFARAPLPVLRQSDPQSEEEIEDPRRPALLLFPGLIRRRSQPNGASAPKMARSLELYTEWMRDKLNE